MKTSKRFRGNRGQALMQVVIAAALLAVVMGGFATMMSQMGSVQAQMQSRQDVTSVMADVQTLFSSPSTCAAALDPNATFNFAAAQKAYPNGQTLSLKLSAADTLKKATPLNSYRLITNDIQFVNSSLVGPDTSGNNIYYGSVLAQFSPKKSGSGLTDFNIRTLATGYLTVNASNKIIGCTADAPAGDLQKAAANCVALGGTFDMTSKKCSLVPEKMVLNCPSGQAITGIAPDGTAQCAAVVASGGTGSGSVPTTIAGVRCPAGQGVAGFAVDGTPQCSSSIGDTGSTGSTGASGTLATCMTSGGSTVPAGTVVNNCNCLGAVCNGSVSTCASGTWVSRPCKI